MPDEKPLEEAAKAASKELVRQIYPDAKAWLTSIGKWLKKSYAKITTETFKSPEALLYALSNNLVKDGDRVTIECKPSLFGPFLRNHFLSPMIGNHTSLRLGPPLQAPNPIMGMMAHITSQLTPVGLYPSIDEYTNQACLYPIDTPAMGFTGLFPGVNQLVTYIPALLASRHTAFCNMESHVTGNIRMVSAHQLRESGFSPEICEEIRQIGLIWFLDATDDDSECSPLGEAITTELWGALYASGHFEIADGQLQIAHAVDAFRDALVEEGYEPFVDQNRAGRKEIMLFAKGFRMCIDTQSPLYSFHMDGDLSLAFKQSRNKFDRVCNTTLENIIKVCSDNSVELRNARDLDFSYTNSTNAYSILKSVGAEHIRDPLAVAIRDWHRKRGA